MTATVCVPKFYSCHLIDPITWPYSTGFVPGPTNCVLQFTAERRARLVAGGAFFRSVGFGAGEDVITVACDWLDGGSLVTTNINLMQFARLTVTDGLITNVFTAPQVVDNIIGVDDISLVKTFTISGNHIAQFPGGAIFTVVLSSHNNGAYTVHTSGATLVGGDTQIPVTALTLDPTVDGFISTTNAIPTLRAQCPANGFQVVNVGGAKTGGSATGLANNATVYTATVSINGATPILLSITGSTAQTYTALLGLINAALSINANAALVGGNIQITSNLSGYGSTILITDTNLFSTLTGFIAINAVVDGSFVIMPTIDGIQPWSPGSEVGYIGNFATTSLVGGGPPAPSPAIRTGPIFTVLFFTATEDGGGNSIPVNLVKYWNGTCWAPFSIGGDCYDPIFNPCSSPYIC